MAFAKIGAAANAAIIRLFTNATLLATMDQCTAMLFKLFTAITNRRTHTLYLGTRGPFGLLPVGVDLDRLRTHLYVVGQSGQGKSKLLQHLLAQLVRAGWGCGVIDPHSDLAGDLLAQLASYPRPSPWLSDAAQRRRVIYLDPSRTDYVVPANLLKSATATPYEIAENVVEAFKRVWPQTLAEAPRFAQIMRNALVVLAQRGLSLLELEPFLTDATLRRHLLHGFSDAQVTGFFATQYNRWGREQVIMAGPVLNKVSAFLFQPAVRLSLGATENRLDFRRIIDGGQILIVDLGGLTGETQQLYGSLLVTGLEQAAMSRRNLSPAARRPFFCMIDEFPFFCARDSTTLARILSELRKFNCYLTLAHQSVGQTDQRMQSALENAKLKCAFATGRQTAQALAGQLFLPDTEAVKHVVEDTDQQARSHPLFESLYNQLEMAVQELMRLKPRQVMLKLPDSDKLLKLTTPTVPRARSGAHSWRRSRQPWCGKSGSRMQTSRGRSPGACKPCRKRSDRRAWRMMAATGAGRKDFGSRAWKRALPRAAPEPSKGTVCPIL